MYATPLEACYARGPGVDPEFGNVWCDDGAGLAGFGDSFTQRLLESQVTKSIAFYAQADWEFSPSWILTAGLRWTEEKKDFSAGQAYRQPRAPPANQELSIVCKFKEQVDGGVAKSRIVLSV